MWNRVEQGETGWARDSVRWVQSREINKGSGGLGAGAGLSLQRSSWRWGSDRGATPSS